MRGFALLKGTAFDWDGTAFRIERVQPDGDVLLERLSDGAFIPVSRARLLDDYTHGRVSFGNSVTALQRNVTYSRTLGDLSAPTKAATHRRWQYVQALLELHSFTFTRPCLQPLIAQVAERIGDTNRPSITTLYRWYSRYRMNRDACALIPRTDRRGPIGSHLQQAIVNLLTESIQEAFKASPQSTVQSIYVRLVGKIDAENLHRMPGDRLKCPSRRTVYRLVSRMSVYDDVALREGKNAADKRLRLNKAGTTTADILERVEMDHTPLDLFLIDEKTWLPLGRPTLTVVVDHYSRMLLGYYLSFGDPSAAAVVGALRHAILPKKPTVSVVPGIAIEHRWPCYGLPDLLVVDNGLEFHGRDLDGVSLDLGMKILFCPKHQPRFKGTVERYLKTVNHGLAQQLPGTSFSRLHLRGDYDPQKHALLTMAEFVSIFEKWVLDVYAQQIHRGIGVTPWSRWHEGLQRREPNLPADVHNLQRRIGRITERSLRRTGISLEGIRYSGDGLQGILSSYGERIRVRVLFDPEDLGAIQVWGPNQEQPTTVLAVDQSYARGLTSRQNELIRQSLREKGAATEDAAALQRAKHELATAVQELMSSRKQRQRRRSGAIRGISSSKPHGEVVAPQEPTVTRKPAATGDQPSVTEDDVLSRYPMFRVKR